MGMGVYSGLVENASIGGSLDEARVELLQIVAEIEDIPHVEILGGS
jgi:hypothetical protein